MADEGWDLGAGDEHIRSGKSVEESSPVNSQLVNKQDVSSSQNNGFDKKWLGATSSANADGSSVMHARSLTQCKECGKNFKALRRHIQDVHRKKPLIDCPKKDCPRKGSNGFGRVDNLRDHLRRVHEIPIPKMNKRKKKDAK
ncbi:hypothetical protein BDD12DRAFT_804434 [Trichophaea hybrida]|nr:hypothetical protein BDD12DRAFT_804434 [Trichophaea hybrida]